MERETLTVVVIHGENICVGMVLSARDATEEIESLAKSMRRFVYSKGRPNWTEREEVYLFVRRDD